jgi:hypothetical protein
MYSDPSCQEFGLQYSQIRKNAILTNAGWFSNVGEKLGVGDLSMQDLVSLSRGLPIGEVFFAISEADCLSIPSNLDRLSPGIDFVVNNAIWAANSADIFKLDSSINLQKLEMRDGVSYIKLSRTEAINNWVAGLAVPVYIKKIDKASHWGLDIYHMHDDASYAVGAYQACYEAASKAAYESLWDTDPDIFARYIALTSYDISSIAEMQEASEHKCNNLIAKLLGNQMPKCVDYMIRHKGFAYYLDLIDNTEIVSDTIPGLPLGQLAYRIDD